MVYYRIQDMKKACGEKGDTNNEKLRYYGELGDNYMNAILANVNGVVLPLTAPDEIIRDYATALGVAYFFKFESGDERLAEKQEEIIQKWFDAKYKRPKFIARSPT